MAVGRFARARWKEGGEGGGERGGWVELVELRGPAKRDAEVKAGRVAGVGRGAGFGTKDPSCNFNCLLRASLPFRACWRWADVFHSLQLIFSYRGIATQSYIEEVVRGLSFALSKKKKKLAPWL